MKWTENIFERFGHDIQAASQIYNVPADLIAAVILAESGGKIDAIGPSGEIGLMQLTPIAIEEVNRQYGSTYTILDMYNPVFAIRAGTMYLRILYDQFHDWQKVIAAYNAGSGAVYRGTVPDSTKRYVRKVIRFWKGLP